MSRRRERPRSLPPATFIHPIHYTDFGDPDKDPCFGKLYSLTAPECQACGDFELCATVFAQRQNKKRLDAEKEVKTKDLELYELEFKKNVKEYFNSLLLTGKYSKVKALRKTARRFNNSISGIKQII